MPFSGVVDPLGRLPAVGLNATSCLTATRLSATAVYQPRSKRHRRLQAACLSTTAIYQPRPERRHRLPAAGLSATAVYQLRASAPPLFATAVYELQA